MSKTLQQIAGEKSYIDFTDPNDPEFRIRFSDVKDALRWDAVPVKDEPCGEKIVAAVLLTAGDRMSSVTDGSNDIQVDFSFNTSEEREGQRKVGYAYTVTVWQIDKNPANVDADSM